MLHLYAADDLLCSYEAVKTLSGILWYVSLCLVVLAPNSHHRELKMPRTRRALVKMGCQDPSCCQKDVLHWEGLATRTSLDTLPIQAKSSRAPLRSFLMTAYLLGTTYLQLLPNNDLEKALLSNWVVWVHITQTTTVVLTQLSGTHSTMWIYKDNVASSYYFQLCATLPPKTTCIFWAPAQRPQSLLNGLHMPCRLLQWALMGNIRWLFMYPPLQKYYRQFFVCRIHFVGLTGKIGNVVTGNNLGNLFPCDYQKVLLGLSALWGNVNRVRTRITRNIGNAIAGSEVWESNLEQLLEKLAIGNLWLPAEMFDELLW